MTSSGMARTASDLNRAPPAALLSSQRGDLRARLVAESKPLVAQRQDAPAGAGTQQRSGTMSTGVQSVLAIDCAWWLVCQMVQGGNAAPQPSKGVWAPTDDPHTPEEAARRRWWTDANQPGGWTAIERRFRDGHHEIWWAAELTRGATIRTNRCA